MRLTVCGGGIGWDNSQSRADCYGAIFRKRLLRA